MTAESSTGRPAGGALDRTGLLLGLGGYVLWGTLPLYFAALGRSGAVEVIAHRALWSLAFCLLLLAVTHQLRGFLAVFRNPRALGTLAVAALLVCANWLLFVFAVQTGHVVEASLGYFINPLLTAGLAVVVLRERLRTLQWCALGVGAVAVVVITTAVGRAPWIALGLAFSFGLYGLAKNRVGRTVGAVPGLAVETTVLAPLGLAYLVWFGANGEPTFTAHGPGYALLLAASGAITAIPLLLFSAAARRLPLSVIGLMQYITPMMQFLLGVLVFGEHMPTARWVGFVLVWAALGLLSVDALRNLRRPRLGG